MRVKQITARRQRNQALATIDAANRCAVCKVDLATAREIVEDFLVRGKCCSDACLETLLANAERQRRE